MHEVYLYIWKYCPKRGGGKIGAIIPDSIKEVFSVVVVVENRPKGRLERVK